MLDPWVQNLDFSGIKNKMRDPHEGNNWSESTLEFAEQEYRRFLTLCLLEPHLDVVPSRLVDEFWHNHILDTMAYQDDCQKVFGGYLHHYPYLGLGSAAARRDLDAAFSRTVSAYETHFGPYPEDRLAATRCAGHACHVPSACACRVPGTCKNNQVPA
ncbi:MULTISPECIES: hypothetical protein [unclassified Thioalkalivibrio]|uniref:glycine-rich domain-containing protein n=1 Tax=unclassified Thioalkalivibrio TaxID=2621013 RepID=UPI00036BC895|nr:MULTISPECIES: hypothetical protein [unclassified Thioalkalivibrio]